jgi:DNA-binding MarR family transcriptional regulator
MEIADALVQLSHLVQYVFADVSREHDLTPQQTQLLCRLTAGPIGMTELSRSLHLEKSSLTGLVDRVERRGLVARTPDPNDRRAFQIALTGRGRRLANESHRDITDRLRILAAALPAADRNQVASAIGRILTESTSQRGDAVDSRTTKRVANST